MQLGAFSISLAVKDLEASKIFYEKLGFSVFGGAMKDRYLIMKNGIAIIGLFQGMFDGTILTFNPGWDQDAQELQKFSDVRAIHTQLKQADIPTAQESLDGDGGPGSFIITDPDGNMILIDQHV